MAAADGPYSLISFPRSSLRISNSMTSYRKWTTLTIWLINTTLIICDGTNFASSTVKNLMSSFSRYSTLVFSRRLQRIRVTSWQRQNRRCSHKISTSAWTLILSIRNTNQFDMNTNRTPSRAVNQIATSMMTRIPLRVAAKLKQRWSQAMQKSRNCATSTRFSRAWRISQKATCIKILDKYKTSMNNWETRYLQIKIQKAKTNLMPW